MNAEALDCLLETNVSHEEIAEYLGLSLFAVVQRHRAMCQSLSIPTQYESVSDPSSNGSLPLPSYRNLRQSPCARI